MDSHLKSFASCVSCKPDKRRDWGDAPVTRGWRRAGGSTVAPGWHSRQVDQKESAISTIRIKVWSMQTRMKPVISYPPPPNSNLVYPSTSILFSSSGICVTTTTVLLINIQYNKVPNVILVERQTCAMSLDLLMSMCCVLVIQ